jgi:hypothetical protein
MIYIYKYTHTLRPGAKFLKLDIEKQVDIKKIGGGGRVYFLVLSSLPQIK